jgi:hypothetical protein
MQREDSFPCSQEPTIGPYPKPDESKSTFSNPISLTSILVSPIYAHVLQVVSFLFSFLTKNLNGKRKENWLQNFVLLSIQ